MPSRVKRRPRHAAKRAQPRLLRLPKVSVTAAVPAAVKASVKAAVTTSVTTSVRRAVTTSVTKTVRSAVGAPARASGAVLARWKHRRATLSLEHRRARALVGGAVVVVALVLLTSFPISGLLSQRSAISATAHEITTLRDENAALARQASDLADPATVNNLARHDYGFVRAGQHAYDILPSSGGAGSGSSVSGQVPLNEPPVVPGSARSQALVGVVAPARPVSRSHAPSTSSRATAGGQTPAEPRGYWARVVRSLEFWN